MYLHGVVFISIITGLLQFVSGQHDSVFRDDLEITVAPSVSKIYVHKNSPLVVNCPVTSSSKHLDFFWFKDEVKVQSNKRVYTADNGSLVIEKVINKRRKGRNDAGIYECFVKNRHNRILGRRVEIIITKQSLTIYPEKVSVIEGGVARFQCKFNDSSQLTPYYIWQTSSNAGNHVVQERTSDMSILQVYNVSKQNAGPYTCKVVHNDGMVEKSAFLEIIEESSGRKPRVPELLNTGQVISVEVGHTALLECLVQWGTNMTITWYREKGILVVPSDRLSFSGNSNLKINRTQIKDSGNYTCVVSHSGGQDIHRSYTVNVLYAPKFKIVPEPILKNLLVQRARLQCNVSGNPPPVTIWYKDGLRIYPTPEAKLIVHGRSDDIGYYQCLAMNSVGHIISTTWVTFDRKPNTPNKVKNVVGEALSPTVIQLKWDPVSAPMLGYGIDYREVSDMQCPGLCRPLLQLTRELTIEMNFNITNLKPFTLYAFSIQGYNYNGAGERSEEVEVRTLAAVPSTVPDIQIQPDTTTSFRVQWTEISPSEANGKIDRHVLYYGTELKMQRTELLDPKARDYLVTGREPDTLYKVRVLAGNSAGYPDITDNWVTYRTPTKKFNCTATTPILSFTPLNFSAVLIEWITDQQGVGSYRVILQNQIEGGPAREFNISASKNVFIIGGMKNRTFYKVDFIVKDTRNNIVCMVTELYESRSPDDTQDPPPPMTIDPVPISASVILLSWKKPRTSLNIDKYTVKYEQGQGGDEMLVTSKFTRNTTQMARLEGLQSFTNYVIAIRSHTADGFGPYSKPVIVQTLEGIPSPPEILLAEVVSPGTVMIEWGPPRKQNGIITYYIVYYNPDKNVPEQDWSTIQQNASTTTIVVNDLTGKIYFFKLRACTRAGEGYSSDIIMINTCDQACPHCTKSCETNSSVEPPQLPSVFEQRMGIIIGCSIGLICCIICVAVIVVKHRTYRRLRAAAHTSDSHHVGRYLSQQTNEPTGMASYSPFLNRRLTENSNSDSKGGHYIMYSREQGCNGVVLVGSNGNQVPNGHQFPAERRALLSASSSNSHGMDTSSNPTVDTTTLDSSFTTPDKVDVDITSGRIASCESSEVEESNDMCPVKAVGSKGSVKKSECHSEKQSHSGSRSGSQDSGFEIDLCAQNCDNEKLSSETENTDKPPHQNITC